MERTTRRRRVPPRHSSYLLWARLPAPTRTLPYLSMETQASHMPMVFGVGRAQRRTPMLYQTGTSISANHGPVAVAPEFLWITHAPLSISALVPSIVAALATLYT